MKICKRSAMNPHKPGERKILTSIMKIKLLRFGFHADYESYNTSEWQGSCNWKHIFNNRSVKLYVRFILLEIAIKTLYLEPCQLSKMELFLKIVNG